MVKLNQDGYIVLENALWETTQSGNKYPSANLQEVQQVYREMK